MEVSIITVGDELLIGQVIDTNSAWMGGQLEERGFKIKEILSISDHADAIIEALDRSFKHSDILLMTGGLGPTKDDITKKTIADYFEDDMYFDEATFNRIQRLFTKLGRTPLEAHRLQCYMPKKASILRNSMGTAPGMLFKNGKKILVSMPGVPYEMKAIMNEEVLPLLEREYIQGARYKRTIRTIGNGESQIAEKIADILERFPDYISIAYLPGMGQVRLRISGSGSDLEQLKVEVESYVTEISEVLGDLVFGYDEDTIESVIGNILTDKKLKIAFAESCTGGYLSHRVTSIPGSSQYLEGSFVTYSYDLKERLLDVNHETLITHGAVSEETVIEMVHGCLNKTSANIAISISGIAGPGGGTPDKPVGTIWLAISNGDITKTKKLSLLQDREKNIQRTAVYALNLLRKFLKEQY